MVRVVLRVMDIHVLEQYEIFTNDVVYPGLDLSYVPLYSPRASILQLRLKPWEEVKTHVHQPRRRELVCNGLQPRCAFRLHQVAIEISGHQELAPLRLIPDGRNDVLYDRGVDGGDHCHHLYMNGIHNFLRCYQYQMNLEDIKQQ